MTIPEQATYLIAPDGDERFCTVLPIVILQGGKEIERFDPPICYGSGRTLTVDGNS